MIKAELTWHGGTDAMARELDDWWGRFESRLPDELSRVGEKAVAYARANHPWANRTGAAERGLSFRIERNGDDFAITLYHEAPHGIWLETRWAGRWGILPKAMTSVYGDVMAAVGRAMQG